MGHAPDAGGRPRPQGGAILPPEAEAETVIIKGGAAGNVGWWGKHLQRDDTNDRAEVMEISGLLAEDMPTALREMQAIAAQSRSGGNFMYQANLNPLDHEHLTPAQWREAVDTLEKNLGLEGHQRVVVEHEKEGRTHRHVIWNRVDVDTLRVTDIGGNYYTHEKTSRELEQRFGLQPVPSLHGEQRPDGRPERAPELADIRAAERSGIDPKELKAELTELWRSADSGQAFAAALEDRGLMLAKGDRRDFCVVDHAGDAHSLARRLDGVKAKDVRERMADIDRDGLPTVNDAREQQRARYPTHEAVARAWDSRNGQAASHEPAGEERDQPPPEPRAIDEAPAHHPVDEPRVAFAAEAGTATRPAAAAEPVADLGDTIAEVSAGIGKGAFVVFDAAAKTAEKLIDFVDGLLGGSSSPPSPPPKPDPMEQIRAQRRALAALENIRESVQQGQSLSAADVRNLTPEHLLNIRARGDAYLNSVIEQMDRDRERQRDEGRTRER
jgi:hypothetical protein